MNRPEFNLWISKILVKIQRNGIKVEQVLEKRPEMQLQFNEETKLNEIETEIESVAALQRKVSMIAFLEREPITWPPPSSLCIWIIAGNNHCPQKSSKIFKILKINLKNPEKSWKIQ